MLLWRRRMNLSGYWSALVYGWFPRTPRGNTILTKVSELIDTITHSWDDQLVIQTLSSGSGGHYEHPHLWTAWGLRSMAIWNQRFVLCLFSIQTACWAPLTPNYAPNCPGIEGARYHMENVAGSLESAVPKKGSSFYVALWPQLLSTSHEWWKDWGLAWN